MALSVGPGSREVSSISADVRGGAEGATLSVGAGGAGRAERATLSVGTGRGGIAEALEASDKGATTLSGSGPGETTREVLKSIGPGSGRVYLT